MALALNVGFNDLIRDIAATAAKVAPRPHMPPPIALPHRRKFPQQYIGTLSLQPLYQSADRHLGWYRQHHVNMVSRDMSLQDIDALPSAFFPHHVANPLGNRTPEHFMTILGDPDHMQMDGKHRVGTMTIVAHVPSIAKELLKLPPKGGGFNPPHWRQ
jgi:hypothetical protein